MALNWYVVHTYSGFENKAKQALEERVRSLKKENFFGKVLVPSENVVEVKKGVRKTTNRKFFPGYILVQVDLNEETWHVVKDTPKILGFVGNSRTPPAVSPEEVDKILQQMEQGMLAPKPRFNFEKGEQVKVIDGPFSNFMGFVEEVMPEKGKLKVLVSIFGRSTPIELEFSQVEKG